MDKIKALRLRNPEALIQTLGRRLRRQRLAAGMTQQERAERSGVSISTLKLMEQKGKGSLQRLAKVAVVLGLDGDLRNLFSSQRSFESLEAMELAKRQRAPQRRNRQTHNLAGNLAQRVAEHMAEDALKERQ
jgi:transcriptional regulator with XRE-family HTH domain